MFLRLLPWEYAIRNLFRRPMRTAVTFCALTAVVVLVFVVIGFIRGLERSLAATGDARTAVVFSLGMGENLEYSSIPARTHHLVAASVTGIEQRYGQKYVSPELYLGTQLRTLDQQDPSMGPSMGLVRGVTESTLLVRHQVQLERGGWMEPGQVIVGTLAAAKLAASKEAIAVGQTLDFEGRSWEISGIFSAGGSAYESEIWCRLEDLQQAMQRQDLSLVAVTLKSADNFADLDLFCKERHNLNLQAMHETEYYDTLRSDYGPIRSLAWLVVTLIAGAGVLVGLTTMYASVVGRTPELAMLQTIGFSRRAIVVSLMEEGLLLSVAASLVASFVALSIVDGLAVRFTMGAFALCIDNTSLLIGCGIGVSLALLGTIPPALRALHLPVVEGLRAI